MKAIYALLFLFILYQSSPAQNVTISGEKYEEPYSSIVHGIQLTPNHVNWRLIEQRNSLARPFPFLNNRFITTRLSLTGANILTENDRYFLSTVPISIENRSNPLRGLAGKTDSDTLSVGQVIILETDSIMSLEFRNVAMELYNVERDSFWFLDLRFNYKYEIDFREDQVRVHFGETIVGPSAEEQIGDLFIFSATAFQIYSEGRTFLFADGDPESPEFHLVFDELPDYGLYALQSIPEEGTVFEFNFANTTSNALQVADQKIEVYPIPGKNYFQLAFGMQEFYYEVHNMSGQLMTSGLSYGQAKVETSDWMSGLYHISVESEGYSAEQLWMKAQY